MALRLPLPIRTLGPLALLVPLVVAAVMWLAIYSYRYVEQLAAVGTQNLVAVNRALADMALSSIEDDLRSSEKKVLEAIDAGGLDDPNRIRDIMHGESSIAHVVVLDPKLEIVPDGRYSKHEEAVFSAFFAQLEQRLPVLGVTRLPVDQPVHVYLDSSQTLVALTHKQVGERDLTVIIAFDVQYLLSWVFPDHLVNLDAQCFYQVLDADGNFQYGHRTLPAVDRRLVAERPFPSMLAGWKLKVLPRQVPPALRKESTLRPFDVALIALAALTILVGLGVLVSVVRAERRANRIKSEFVANVSHELKTPLSLIKMFGELLASGRARTPESAKEYAEIITRESERLSTLIDNVLDFARLERGKLAYAFAPGDVGQVVTRSLDVYRTLAEREGVVLEVKIEPGLPPVILDADAMSLVVMNLVDNALKYAQTGKEIVVSVARSKGGVRLDVADRGPGIARDEQERVFERFYRGKTASERPVRGSGIGLSLVKNIAVAHGGDVTVVSTPGQGSTFSVTLPASKG